MFFIIDSILSILVLLITGVLFYSLGKDKSLLTLFRSAIDATFALILVISAFYLTKQTRNCTRKSSNICLLNWHIFNLILRIGALIFLGVQEYEMDECSSVKNCCKKEFLYDCARLAFICS